MRDSATITCEWCGSAATIAYSGNGRPGRYCSEHCRQASGRLVRQQDNEKHGAARQAAWRARHPEHSRKG